MHERQIEELLQVRIDTIDVPGIQCLSRIMSRKGVRGVHPSCAAESVSGKLIGEDEQRERSVRSLVPDVVAPRCYLLVEGDESIPECAIKVIGPFEPVR